MPPLVTVITPTYNCSKFLGKTMDSVLSQRGANFEYIVLDDGSTDNTPAVLKLYCDRRLRIERHENMGEQKTVNLGLSMVKGKYFMIVNADDPLLPGAISTLVEFMEQHPKILCAYPDWNAINEDGSFRTHVKSREYDFSWMVRHHTCIPSVGSMFRSAVIQSVGLRDTSYRWLGDFDYWLRVGLQGDMCRVSKTLATWRHRDGQASADKSDARALEHQRIAHLYADNPEGRCWGYLVASAVCQSKQKSLEYIWEAVKVYPQLLVTWDFWDVLRSRAIYILRR